MLLPKDTVTLEYTMMNFSVLMHSLEKIGRPFVVNPATNQIAISKDTLTILSSGVA